MTRFYFVRHGKTVWNLEGRYQGARGDSPLLPESYQDIKSLARFLRPQHIDWIYSSPIKRAYLTAQTLDQALGGDIPLSTNAALKEFDLGIIESVVHRTNDFIKGLAHPLAAQTQVFIIVSHGAASVAMIKGLLKVPLHNFRDQGGLANTSLTTLDTYDHGQSFQLIKWNDTSFLQRPTTQTDTI